ncbi:MAG: hotdog fold domain-containing protein [Patescibacteria group bacterium]|nr:hotdog fold domain-containing protein [Patescibacteria group bacterium]MDD5567226.1 hotdog fold domain-containing protein [Patescibacteria group bacterium]
MSSQPTQVTPFAQTLGIDTIGSLDEGARTYVVEHTPSEKSANFFRTVHGGLLQGILDDSAGMLIFLLHGVNSAITVSSQIRFLRATRLGQPLRFIVRIDAEDEKKVRVTGEVRGATCQIAEYSSEWIRRARRG